MSAPLRYYRLSTLHAFRRVIRLAVHRAPKGGVTIGGKVFRGGMFIPAGDMQTLRSQAAAGDPEAEQTLAEVETHKAAQESRLRSSKHVDHAALDSTLSGVLQGLDVALPRRHRASTNRAYATLERHHGGLIFHRLAELIDADRDALSDLLAREPAVKDALAKPDDAVSEDELAEASPGAYHAARRLAWRLAGFQAMLAKARRDFPEQAQETSNAVEEGFQQEDHQQERQRDGEVGPPAEAGRGSGPALGGQEQQGQEEIAANPPQSQESGQPALTAAVSESTMPPRLKPPASGAIMQKSELQPWQMTRDQFNQEAMAHGTTKAFADQIEANNGKMTGGEFAPPKDRYRGISYGWDKRGLNALQVLRMKRGEEPIPESRHGYVYFARHLQPGEESDHRFWPLKIMGRLPYALAARDPHRAFVEEALAEGQPVPPEVLADYPDLAAKGGAA